MSPTIILLFLDWMLEGRDTRDKRDGTSDALAQLEVGFYTEVYSLTLFCDIRMR